MVKAPAAEGGERRPASLRGKPRRVPAITGLRWTENPFNQGGNAKQPFAPARGERLYFYL